jgi:hypothetical protein
MVNAVAGLAGAVTRLDALGREQFGPFFLEAATFQEIIDSLVNACLGRRDEFERSGAPLFEYPLVPDSGGEEAGPGRDAPLPPSTANTVSLTLSSLQVSSLAGSLGEAFGGFTAQTAMLADIYSPPVLPDVRPGTVTGRADTTTVLEKLSRSASVLRSLERVRSDLTRTLNFQKTAAVTIPVTESRIPPGTPSRVSRDGVPHVPARAGIARREPGLTVPSPVFPGTIFTTLHGMLRKSEEMVDLPTPAEIASGHLLLPVTEHRAGGILAQPPTTLPRPPLPDHKAVQEKSGRRTAKPPGTRSRSGIIEISPLVPAEAVSQPSGMAAMNAERFSEGIARLSGTGTTQTVLSVPATKVPSPAVLMSRSTDASSPLVAIPEAFEQIARYVTYSSEIHRQLVSSLYSGASRGPGVFPVPFPFTASEGGGALMPGIPGQGKEIRVRENIPVMNVAVSLMSSEGMRRAYLPPRSAPGGVRTAGMPSGNAFSGTVPVSSLYSLEHALPLSAGPRDGAALPAPGGTNPVHIQNTFNITVTTTSRGDDAELRELGRKIGVILSDEMRRYGGLR